MIRLCRIATLPLVLALAACQSNPVLVDDGKLSAELALSTSHVHTLSEVSFDVVIRNGDGYAVDDFEAVSVDRRQGEDAWRSIELTPTGSGFSGAYTFASSGSYDLRVSVVRHGASEPVEVPLADPAMAHMEAARAHVEMDGYRVEFETFPGHMHQGEEVTVKFWILEAEQDASGSHPPITGLDAKVLCFEQGQVVEDHHAHAHDDGVYEASHVFQEAGAASAGLRFTDAHGAVLETSFDFSVAHTH